MSKTLKQRVNDSFSTDDKEQIIKYMDWVRSAMSDIGQTMRRNATFLLLLIAIFEIVVQSRKTTLSIGSFTVTRDSIVLVFIPATVSFLYLQLLIDSQKVDRLDSVFYEAFKMCNPKVSGNSLNQILGNSLPAYWTVPSTISWSDQRFDKLEYRSSSITLIVILTGVFAFEAQAYYVLFPVRASTIVPWTISLLITLYCLIFSLFFMRADTGT